MTSSFDLNVVEDAMRRCVALAKKEQTPFAAAILSRDGDVLAIAANRRKSEGPLAHAEMNVLRMLNEELIEGAALVTTCEPCPMCAGAAIWSKVGAIYFGASIEDASQYMHQIMVSCDTIASQGWKPPVVFGGVLSQACVELFANTCKRS